VGEVKLGNLPLRNPEAPPIVSVEVKPMPGETSQAVIANARLSTRKGR